MQSRCKARVTGGYESVSVTVGEIFVGTWAERRGQTLQDVWTILVCSVYSLRGEGVCRE